MSLSLWKNKWLRLAVLVTLIIALLFAAVFGTIAAVNAAGAVMRYNGIQISEGVYTYFSSYCKMLYLATLRSSGVEDAADSAAFFARDRGDGTTYGEDFAAYTEEYVRTVAVSAWLFDSSVGALSKQEKKTIRDGVDGLVEYRADGDSRRFEELCATYGFTYRDILNAVTLQYKAEHLFSALYGQDASYMLYDTEACETYFAENYVRVKLLFIRTADRLSKDENGQIIYDQEGEPETIPLSDGEKTDRQNSIASLDAALAALAAGQGALITEEMLSVFQSKYGDGDPVYDLSGWYFAPNAEQTQQFAALYPTIAEAALSAEVGSYQKVTYEDGVCYIYRMTADADAYADEDVSVFFSDFAVDCAIAKHKQLLGERTPDVHLTERFASFDPTSVPYNYDLFVRLP